MFVSHFVSSLIVWIVVWILIETIPSCPTQYELTSQPLVYLSKCSCSVDTERKGKEIGFDRLKLYGLKSSWGKQNRLRTYKMGEKVLLEKNKQLNEAMKKIV